MKTCDEMVNSLLKRRERFLLEQKQKRKTAAKITAAGGCCALAAVIGIGIRNSGMLREKHTVVPENSSAISDNFSSVNSEPAKEIPTPQVPDHSSVIWADGGSGSGVDGFGMLDNECYETFGSNGKRIYPSLSEAFEKYDDDSVFAIAAYCYGYDDNFVYNGKTLAQYIDEEMAIWDKIELRLQLLKCGDSLKYGEALYQTGTPDGERWAESYYYNEVSRFGQELISEYIVDGEFLKDKLTEDLRDLDNERKDRMQSYERARIACSTYIFETAAEQINAQGVYCETKYSSDRPYLLVIFATKDEFEALSIDNIYKWHFALAQKNENEFFASDFIDECGVLEHGLGDE